MSIEIASVSLPVSLNLSGFNSGLKDIEKTKIDPIVVGVDFNTKDVDAQRTKLEKLFSRGLDLKIRVDDSELYDLNKHLDLKDAHVRQLQRNFDRSPLTVRVDTSEIDEAVEKLNYLEKKGASKTGSKSSSSSSSSSFSSSDTKSALDKGFSDAANNIKKSVDIITKPIQQAMSGLFEGVGQSIAGRLTKGVMGTLEQKGVLKMDAITDGISNLLTGASDKISKSFKKQAKGGTASPIAMPDLSNLGSLKGQSERVAVELIPKEVPKQFVQKFEQATQEAGKILGNKLMDSLQEDFSLLDRVLKGQKPDIGKAEAQFTKIREGFKSAYAGLNKSLADGNIQLAQSYQATIKNMAVMARQEIDKIQAELKAEGASGRFGARLPTMAGATKGHITQYEQKADRKSLEINKQVQAGSESAQIGADVVKGVSKGLSSVKGVQKQSSAVASTIINTLKDDLEIRSPSKKGIQIGIDFVKGITVGITNTSNQVISQGKKLSQNLQGSLTPSKAKVQAPKSQNAIAQESATAAMDNFYTAFGKRFKTTVFKGMPDDVANEMAGEVAGMLFSGLSMAFPSAIAAVGIGPMLIAALPTVITGLGLTKLLSPIVARTIEGIKTVEPIRQRFDVLGGSQEAGKAEFSYANKVAEKYSVSKESSLTQYSQMAIAARGTKLEGEGVKELFEGISASTRALKLSTADTNLVFMAYTQMLAKGKISMEELRQQLGERFPPAMGVFAKAMGTSVTEMGQMIESGNALSEDVLPKVGAVLKQDFGKAASGGGGLLTAFTAIENAGFDLSVKLTESFSGLFGAITNIGAGIFNIFNQNFDLILKLASAFVIGITAQVAVGLQQIMMMPGLSGALAGVQGMFLSTFSKSMMMLAPFMFGMFIDVADDFLGAQHSIFENMSKGVTNAVLTVITFIDDASRNLTGSAFFKPDHDNALIGFFVDIGEKIKGVFQVLPPGLVEMGALMIMFEQVSVLGKMFLVPTFESFKGALGGMTKGLISAFTNGNNLKSMFRIMIADSAMAKGAMIALGVAAKGALAFAVLAFASGDFSDDLAKAFSKAEGSIVNSIKSIGNELSKLKDAGKQIGESVQSIELKSKGVELNPLKILGISDDSFKWDDWSKQINEDVAKGRSALTDSEKSMAQDFKKRADNLGVGDFFTGQEKRITRGQQQAINKAQDLQRMNTELQTRLEKLNLTPSTVQNFVSGDIDKAVKEVQAIDVQLKGLGGKRSDLALINDTQSKAAIKGIDKEIDALVKKRKEKASPLSNALGNVDEIKKQLEDVGKAIDAEDIPPQLKKAYNDLLKPQIDIIDGTVKHLKEAGLYDAVKPLENVWQRVTESLHDAELQFTKTREAADFDYKEIQAKIYQQFTDKGSIDSALEGAETDFLNKTQSDVSKMLATREAALKELLSISGVETNPQRKEEVDKLKEEIKKGKEELSGLNLEVAKAQSERQLKFDELSKKVDDYYKGVEASSREAALTLAKQTSELDNQQYANQVNRAMLGASDNIISQFVGGLLDAITQISQAADTDLDAQSQIAQAQKAFEDTVKSGEDLRKTLPTITTNLSELPPLSIDLSIDTVSANQDVKALNDEILDSVSATKDLSKATEQFENGITVANDTLGGINDVYGNIETSVKDVNGQIDNSASLTGNLNEGINTGLSLSENLEESFKNNNSAIDNNISSQENFNAAVDTSTAASGYLQGQIDANTMSIDANDASMQSVGGSIDLNTQKTALTTEQSQKWWAELGNVEKISNSVLAVFGAIGVGIMDVISKTVDWFKTFANNIPVLNQVGQTLSGFGSAIGEAATGLGNQAGQQLDRLTNWAGGGGKVTERYRTGLISGQEYGAARPGRKHAGQDIDISGNQEAQSFIGGIVTRVVHDKDGAGYGSYVDIYNKALGVVERIAEVLDVNVKEGQEIKAGQAIGGGESHTGVFHYEIRQADAQGKGGYGYEGSQDPIKFYEKLGIAKREGNDIKILKGMTAGQSLKAAEHGVGDGHNHFGEEDVKKANQGAAGVIAGSAGKMLASMGGSSAIPSMNMSGNASASGRSSGGSGAFDPFAGGSNSFAARVVGHSEGNRTATGGFTDTYKGHTDPGNGQFNVGSFSMQTATHGMKSPEEADIYWQSKLKGVWNTFVGAAQKAGLDPNNPTLAGNFLDLYTQSPAAAVEGVTSFLNQLPKIKAGGGTKDSILQARLSSFYNSAGKLEAWTNLSGLTADQNRRMSAVNAAIPNATKGGVPMMASGESSGASGSSGGGFTPSAPMKVWSPDSLAKYGNTQINSAQDSAKAQRDAQQAAASRQALVQAESGTIQGLQKGYQSLIQVEKQLRQSGYETRDLFEDVGKMNLDAAGPLSSADKRKQAVTELTRQYRDSTEKVREKLLDVQNRQTSAKAILEQPGGVLTPATREKFNKLLSMPIADDLKTRLQEAMTTGVFGDKLREVLQKSVSQGNQEIATLQSAAKALESGEKGALKAAQERFDFEEKARANAAKFELESLSIATLQARLEQTKAQADRDPFGGAKAKIPAMEALISLRQNELDYNKQIDDLEKKKRDKTLNAGEADAQIKEIKAKREVTQQTIKDNQAYQEIANTREKANRDREIGLQAAKDELAVQKQQLETLKALPATDVNRNQIPQLEYQVSLAELQLKLQEDIAAVNEAVFKDPSSKAAGDTRIAKLNKEFELSKKNLDVRLKQSTVEQELAQKRAIIGIREQELGYAEQLLEAQSRSIELGRTVGDTLGGRYELQTQQQMLGFEKSILDVKELALQSGKSAEEIAGIEAKLRTINDIKLDNINAEMKKAFDDRAFAVNQRMGESNNSALSARQSLMSTYGFTQEASRIGKEIAVNQQSMDFTSQKRDLEEFIKTNAVAADKAALLRTNLESVNDVKFKEIAAQFNPLKGVIDSSVGALKGGFKSLIKEGKVDFDSFFDGILDSIADFLSNMIVEQLMGFLSPNKDKKKGGGMFPDATAKPATQEPDFTSLLGIGDDPMGALGKSPVQPMFVNVVNAADLGFTKGANNIVPFSRNDAGGGFNFNGLGGGSIFGNQPDYVSATTDIFGDLGGIFSPGLPPVSIQNPFPVNMAQAKPDIFSSIMGGLGGGGGIGGAIGGIASAIGGGGGFGGIIGSLLPMVGSLFGGLFASGGVIGSGKGKNDDQIILAQRGEGVLSHKGMATLGGVAALNAINSGFYRVPKFATGGVVGGEYGTNGADQVVTASAEREAARANGTIKVETQVINGVEYATVDQVREAAAMARSQGARDGATYISEKMSNSATWRNRHGIR